LLAVVALAHSNSGDVTGELVYANWGFHTDFAALKGMGVDVRGKIAIMRLGLGFRANMVQEAERAGCVGAVLFSDPVLFGAGPGRVVFPDGPWGPESGVERGSVWPGQGDPSTPGWPSVRHSACFPYLRLSHLCVVCGMTHRLRALPV
jgi:N-acetylated-alpha-linked acidic dipeptidase